MIDVITGLAIGIDLLLILWILFFDRVEDTRTKR